MYLILWSVVELREQSLLCPLPSDYGLLGTEAVLCLYTRMP